METQGVLYKILTAMIPAIITGTIHLIKRSGRKTPMAEIPTPDFDVP